MPWYFPWSDAIKLRACRYLLQRYLGQFLQHKIDLNQLSVDLYSGKGVVKDVLLDVELINDTFESANLPLEIVDGFIGKVSVEIPWSALLSDSTHVEIQGLEVTLKPKQVAEKSVMLSSMWGSMTKSSMQLAEECLKEEERNKRSQPSQFEGLEKFAQAIDIVLTRIKVDFTDIIIRLEQVRDDSKTRAVALEVRIRKLRYFDEAAGDSQPDMENVTYQPLQIANKCFYVEGFTIFSDEYSLKPMTASNITLSSPQTSSTSLQNSELFYSTTDFEGPLPPPGADDILLNAVNSISITSSRPSSASSTNNLVQMAVCHGITEVRLKVKQSGETSGPKFELDAHVGILHAVLWPKQLEILRSLFGEVLNVKRPESKIKNELQKPMTDSDYSKIEGELQRDFDQRHHQPRGGNNIQHSMWDNMNASREDDEFYSFASRPPTDIAVPPGLNSDQSPRYSSVTTTNSAKLRFKSCFVNLLEEDPISEVFATSFQYAELQRRSSEHFASMTEIENWDLQDSLALRDRFARSVPQNHIWFCASTVIAEGVEKISANESSLTFKTSIGTLEIWEHLFDCAETERPSHPHGDSIYRLKTAPLCMEILTFPNRSAEDRFSFSPCVLIEYGTVENSQGNLLQRPSSGQGKNSLKISLQNARTDLDITFLDRLQNIIQAGGTVNPMSSPGDSRWSPAPASASSAVPLSFAVSCTNLTAFARFPVLDLRPASDRTAWWTRSLQKECLVVDLAGFVFKTVVDNEPSKRVDFECRNLTAALQNSPDEKPVVFLRGLRDVDAMLEEGRREEFAECPRISIYTRKFSTNVVGTNLYERKEDSPPSGSLDALVDSTEKDPSLFATLRNMVDHEEINYVIPSPVNEAAAFKENVISNSHLVIEISIPSVTAFLPDKDVLEILYNRINTDLLLWEPASRKRGTDVIPLSAANLMGADNAGKLNKFEMCTNSVIAGSDSGSDISEDEYESRHHDSRHNAARRKQKLTSSVSRSRLPSDVCVVFNVTKASIGAQIANSGGKSLPAHTAWMELGKTSVFSVSGYRGQPEIKYSAIKIQQASLYYGDCVESFNYSFDQVFRRPVSLLPLLVAVDEDMSVPGNDKTLDDQPMLNLAVGIHVDTFRNIKDIKVALELAGVRLHHRVTKPEELWLTQIIEFVNLKDFPVLGYNCPTIITEFHLNIANSILDYRPLFLPVSAVVSVDSVNVSSNIVADSPQSLLRVITQDLRLHLSKRKNPSSLRKDYVCVVDVPFVEFQMKLTDGSNPNFPRFDFRASNNCCYIRTCADSCREMSDLIQYLADYGDLNSENRVVKSQSSVTSTVSSNASEETVSEEMMDAMQESPPRRDSIPKSAFTNLVRPPTASPRGVLNMAATLTRSIMPSDFSENDIDDDDFCIIEEDLGVGIPLKSGEPSIRFLTPEPIKIVENHFDQPLVAVDQLKSPDGYPVPVVRFTLREMSLIWCIYGGKDFEISPDSSARKLGPQNRLNSAPAKLGEARTASLKGDKQDQHANTPSWIRQGGVGRDHSVLMELHLNKVRFQHEQYPFDGKNVQAARQVLFVQDVEIRDRLAASEINKFLYQYVSNSLPRQTHASMLAIKALHERPDPTQPMQECSLKVSVQPLRLNVDQESLFFLNDFFADVSGSSKSEKKETLSGGGTSAVSAPTDSVPIARQRRLESLSEEGPLMQSNHLIRFDELPTGGQQEEEEEERPPFETIPASSLFHDDTEAAPVFFKSITFSPEVPIRLDYHGKYVDMQRVGAFGGLLVGLAQLKCSMLRLKRVHSRQGLRGFDKLIFYLLNEWLDDIRKTQLANLLGGVGPIHCLVQLVQGVRDLFWLPVEQYKKDGRIVRGVQRGATAFTTSTLIATIELTNRIVQTVQLAAESAYDVISPGPSFRRKKKLASAAAPPRYSQPGDIREGVVTAYQGLYEGFTDTVREIVEAVSEERDQKGMTGAVGGALRQIPGAIVKPLILTSQATSNVLGGIRNQLQPENKFDEMEKWRTENDVRGVNFQAGNR